jgi:hypothetical protein
MRHYIIDKATQEHDKRAGEIANEPKMQGRVTIQLPHKHVAAVLGSLSSEISLGRKVAEGSQVLQLLVDARDAVGLAAYGPEMWQRLRDNCDLIGNKLR